MTYTVYIYIERWDGVETMRLFALYTACNAYYSNMYCVGPSYGAIALGTALPRVNARGSMQAVGMLGAVIMPVCA